MKSKTKKEEKPFWIDVEDDGTFADIFDADLFDQDCKTAMGKKESIHRHLRHTGSRRTVQLPQKEIDLHGCTGQDAERLVERFIQTARHERLQSLRIITGRGLHSDGLPVLPGVVEQKMAELKEKKLVRSFFWEKKEKSSSGALIVLL